MATSQPSGGRGPTRLICPRGTFHSCGSSSSEVRRRNRPTRVTRGSRSILKACPRIALNDRRSSSRCSASEHMVRNFTTLNVRPCSPTLSCPKNARPGESSLTSTARSAKRQGGRAGTFVSRRPQEARRRRGPGRRRMYRRTETRAIAGSDPVGEDETPLVKPEQLSLRPRPDSWIFYSSQPLTGPIAGIAVNDEILEARVVL